MGRCTLGTRRQGAATPLLTSSQRSGSRRRDAVTRVGITGHSNLTFESAPLVSRGLARRAGRTRQGRPRGDQLLSTVDQIMAVWDGQPSDGHGSTGDVCRARPRARPAGDSGVARRSSTRVNRASLGGWHGVIATHRSGQRHPAIDGAGHGNRAGACRAVRRCKSLLW